MATMKTLLCTTAAIFMIGTANADHNHYQPQTENPVTYSHNVENILISILQGNQLNLNMLPSVRIGNSNITFFEESDPYWQNNNQNCVYKKPSPGSQFTLRQCY